MSKSDLTDAAAWVLTDFIHLQTYLHVHLDDNLCKSDKCSLLLPGRKAGAHLCPTCAQWCTQVPGVILAQQHMHTHLLVGTGQNWYQWTDLYAQASELKSRSSKAGAFNEVNEKWKKRDWKCLVLWYIIDETLSRASVANKLLNTDSLGKDFIIG